MNIVLVDLLIVKNKEITNCKHFTQNVKYKRHNPIYIRKQGLGDENRLLSSVYVCRLLSNAYVCSLLSVAHVCTLHRFKRLQGKYVNFKAKRTSTETEPCYRNEHFSFVAPWFQQSNNDSFSRLFTMLS